MSFSDDPLRLTLGPSNFVYEVQPPVQSSSSSSSSSIQPSSSSIQLSSSSSTVNEALRLEQVQVRRRAGPTAVKRKKNPIIVPPYPWATENRCQVYPLKFLKNHGYESITGSVKCRKCEHSYDMSFDLETAAADVLCHFAKKDLCDRAPDVWMNPILPDCIHCHQNNAVRPEIQGKKRDINWLFLFLGQMLGCCTGEQLKYFCKHNSNHRTAAKNRLLYLVYSSICKQLVPEIFSDT